MESTSSTNRNSRNNVFNFADAQDPRRAMNRRRHDTIQIRKERKESQLRRRRHQPVASAPALFADSLTNIDPSTQLELLRSELDLYLSLHASPIAYNPDSPNEQQLLKSWHQLHFRFQSSKDSVVQLFLDELIQQQNKQLIEKDSSDAGSNRGPRFAFCLVESLSVAVNGIETGTLSDSLHRLYTVLSVVLQISSNESSETKRIDIMPKDTDYYGQSTLTWIELLGSPSHADIVSCLLRILDPSFFSIVQPIVNKITETTCNILGNFVQSNGTTSRKLLKILTQSNNWSLLVANLHYSSYCCAAVLRMDMEQSGMFFCAGLKRLTVDHICNLLLVPTDSNSQVDKAIDAAWILDGLCRREDDVVQYLLSSSSISVLSVFLHRLHQEVMITYSDKSYEFLIPALRALGNICASCEGRYVQALLSGPSQQPFMAALVRLLQLPQIGGPRTKADSLIFSEASQLAGCLLTDAGLPDHPSTTVGVPNLVPHLLTSALARTSNYEIKSASVLALANAVRAPPSPAKTLLEQPDSKRVESTLLSIVYDYIWNNLTDKMHLMQSFVDLLKLDDADTALASMEIINKLIRLKSKGSYSGSSGCEILSSFEACGGVEALEHIGEVFNSTCTVSKLAAQLIDDYFDDDYDNDIVMDAAPAVENDQFLFGLSSVPVRHNSATRPQNERPLTAAFHLSTSAGMGRARGRALPSWMSQVQPRP